MSLFSNNCNKVPARGYKLTLWGTGNDYRSTAIAYLKREGLTFVENSNGKTYSLAQLEGATIKW